MGPKQPNGNQGKYKEVNLKKEENSSICIIKLELSKNNFEFLYVIGKGGFGKVFLALNKMTQEEVAIKFLKMHDVKIEDINNLAHKRGYLKQGDYAINITSMPVKARGMANTIRITEFGVN